MCVSKFENIRNTVNNLRSKVLCIPCYTYYYRIESFATYAIWNKSFLRNIKKTFHFSELKIM